MKNIIGTTKKHKNGYSYLSLNIFPSTDLKSVIPDALIQKSNHST